MLSIVMGLVGLLMVQGFGETHLFTEPELIEKSGAIAVIAKVAKENVPDDAGAKVIEQMPVAVELIEVKEERRDDGWMIGNVQATFADGHREMWTRKGRCMMLKRAASGLVGWTFYTSRNSHGEPVNSTLRVMVSPETWKDLNAPSFIGEWQFADHDQAVLVKSRGRHGMAQIYKFSIETGEMLEHVRDSKRYADTPDWAKPITDARPR